MRLAALSLMFSCGDVPDWTIPVRIPSEQDPFEGADSLEVRVRRGGLVDAYRFGPGDRQLALPAVSPGEVLDDLSLRALFGKDVTSFGRTPGPVVADEATDPMYFARVRFFAQTVEPPGPGGGFATRTEGGAWVATSEGLARYDHATGEFHEVVALPGADRARFATLESGRVVALQADAALVFDGESFVVAQEGLPDATDSTVVAIPQDRILVVGPDEIWVWDPALPDGPRFRDGLRPARVGASATFLQSRPLAVEVLPDRVLVAGGRDPTTGAEIAELLLVELTDPISVAVQAESLTAPRSDHAAIVVPELPDNVWILGGRGAADALTDSVEAFRVLGIAEHTLAVDPLFRPRANGAAAALPGGDILLVGGETDPPEDAVLTERYLWYLGAGAARLADSLPAPVARPGTTFLDDGSLLVAGGGNCAIYVPDPL